MSCRRLCQETSVPPGFNVTIIDDSLLVYLLYLNDAPPTVSACITLKNDFTVVCSLQGKVVRASLQSSDLVKDRLKSDVAASQPDGSSEVLAHRSVVRVAVTARTVRSPHRQCVKCFCRLSCCRGGGRSTEHQHRAVERVFWCGTGQRILVIIFV